VTKVFDIELDAEQLIAQAEHLERGGLLVPAGEHTPAVMSRVKVRLQTPAGRAEIDAEVVAVIPGSGVGLTVDPDQAKHRIEPLIARAKRGDMEPTAATTIALQAKRMTTEQKREAAQFGDRAQRMAMMKDTNKAIHIYVLKNKKITLDEVRVMATYRNANPEALSQIARHRDWMRDGRIVMALVCNPKTPPAIAVRSLERLSPGDLNRVAKSGEVPRRVVMSAKERLRKSRG
jgi:hypothetical protein